MYMNAASHTPPRATRPLHHPPPPPQDYNEVLKMEAGGSVPWIHAAALLNKAKVHVALKQMQVGGVAEGVWGVCVWGGVLYYEHLQA